MQTDINHETSQTQNLLSTNTNSALLLLQNNNNNTNNSLSIYIPLPMSTFSSSSHRIGSRASQANEYAASSESAVLRSLFELRKSYSHQNRDDSATIQHVTFWNCTWSPRVLQSLRKIFIRDKRRFASIKFLDCAIETDETNNQFFAEILRMILVHNSTTSLVIKGGTLIGNNHYSQQERRPQSSCQFSSSKCRTTSITSALRKELSTNNTTSLTSLTLSGLDFSSPATVEDLSNTLSRNATLQSLNLCQSSLNDDSIAQILTSILGHSTLTSLDLSKNYLGARKSNAAFSSTRALDTLAKLLQSKSSKLEHLNLSHQYQQHAHGATSALLPQMTQEDVHQHISQHKAAFGKALGALSTNTCLKSMDLSQNPGILSDPSTVKMLSACLSENTCLEHVDISNCGMTSKSLVHLASECLPVTSLKSLVLFASPVISNSATRNCPKQGSFDNCNGDCHAALALEKGLLSNVTLENLGDLDCKHETLGTTYQSIQHTLNLNKAGRRVLSSSLPLANWSHLLARADTLDYHNDEETTSTASVVFSLLRQAPLLMEH